ncbi:MAG: methyl-accepting chemotaxis protein [Nitrospinota bacterium]
MNISTKLIASFGAITIFAIVVGVVGSLGLRYSTKITAELNNKTNPAMKSVLDMVATLSLIENNINILSNNEISLEDREAVEENIKEYWIEHQQSLEKYQSLYESDKTDPDILKYIEAIKNLDDDLEEIQQYSEEVRLSKLEEPLALLTLLSELTIAHLQWSKMLTASLVYNNPELQGEIGHIEDKLGNWLVSYQTENEIINKVLVDTVLPHEQFHIIEANIKSSFDQEDDNIEVSIWLQHLEPLTPQLIALLDVAKNEALRVIALSQKIHYTLDNRVNAKFNTLRVLIDKIRTNTSEYTRNRAAQTQVGVGRFSSAIELLLFIGAVFVIGLSIIVPRSISNPVSSVAKRLAAASLEVTTASDQIKASSNSLASGAAEQASALEETSAALEEVAAQTHGNAENAKEASKLAIQTREQAGKGATTVTEMIVAMSDISKASEEISAIIKVIEGIAFQTNLLALNAAVEAARAGEHGKGFAVVAEEVRNLAQRAGEAAKETSDLIENAVTKAASGSNMADKAGKALTEIVSDVERVTSLISEISTASTEQAQGVDQVNISISQMDKVTQQNAVVAEEVAASAEELHNQANNFNANVTRLTSLVERRVHRGNSVVNNPASVNGNSREPNSLETVSSSTEKQTRLDPTSNSSKSNQSYVSSSGRRSFKKNYNKIIPMDDNFDDF